MIPKDHITEWRAHAPWAIDAQVAQDLVISRALVEMFRVPELADSLLFRGGTALYKLYFTPAARYSEDIDLVQVRSEPVGKTIDRARSVLDPWLGTPRRHQHPRALQRAREDHRALCCRQRLAPRACGGADVCARRAAWDEAAGALSAQEGPRPFRPLARPSKRQSQSTGPDRLLPPLHDRGRTRRHARPSSPRFPATRGRARPSRDGLLPPSPSHFP